MLMMVPNPMICYATLCVPWFDDDCIMIVIMVISSGDKDDDIKVIICDTVPA